MKHLRPLIFIGNQKGGKMTVEELEISLENLKSDHYYDVNKDSKVEILIDGKFYDFEVLVSPKKMWDDVQIRLLEEVK